MNFDKFLIAISKIKSVPLPSEASQFKMVPPFRQQLLKQQKHNITDVKKAGVLALFYPNSENKTHFVLILRKTYKGVHSAQIAFPGGKLEAQDRSLKETAIRETYEEIGVAKQHIEVIQKLTEVYIPPSNFHVQPFIGISKKTPRFIKQDTEVETIIEIPLKHFFNDSALVLKTVTTSYSTDIEVPAFKLNGYIVWGATAMMLSEIKDLLKQLM